MGVDREGSIACHRNYRSSPTHDKHGEILHTIQYRKSAIRSHGEPPMDSESHLNHLAIKIITLWDKRTMGIGFLEKPLFF